MPFLIPSLTTLQQQALSDITTANLPTVSGSLLRTSILRVLAFVQAGLAWGQYGFLSWISKQSVPYSATFEFLEAWAALKGVIRKPATLATGSIIFTGTNGTIVPEGTVVSRSDGFQYSTTVDGTISSGTATITVTALTAGTSGNQDAGATVALSGAIAGVNSTGTAGIMTGGADIETDDSLRNRMLIQYALPPNGGSQSDYVEWALQVPGVTRAWCLGNGAGAGTVVVYTMFDVTEVLHNGFPQGTDGAATLETRGAPATGDQLAVANWIYPLRPVTAFVYSAAPTPQTIDVTIANLSPNTLTIQTNISVALQAVLTNLGNPTGSTVYMSELTAAIESVPGVNFFTLVTPSSPIAISVGSLPVLGTLTFA